MGDLTRKSKGSKEFLIQSQKEQMEEWIKTHPTAVLKETEWIDDGKFVGYKMRVEY